ncbi:MAG: DEAD/DEAH box helicase family protein [Thermoanaerobaculia bacterium]|nr:DEAD/DEAH box helicase family protein [Thermoanaerobaculia bacterium]
MSAVSLWERVYDLNEARKSRPSRKEAAHQAEALSKLQAWYETSAAPDAGGLLVLPTGAGKTFTAVRFLCRHPLSDGYKVLWLAHTHHLLEQALDSFGKRDVPADQMEVGWISEPKEHLRTRVVSGTPGHSRIAGVTKADDVVICTLQTAVRAYRENHASLRSFLEAASGKLLVVFDEAHHAPAPSYTEFILALRRQAPNMKLLGLTATPMYNDEKRAGWLGKLFPQRVIFAASAPKLIAASILAKPIAIPCNTRFQPKFDPAEYMRWRESYQDVPETIITQLAKNRERNDLIWKTYVDRRGEFGKTIIFADRWFQCEYIREKLIANGVRAGAVYSHIDADPDSVEARNRRTKDENSSVLAAFHADHLDVLVNVRMLTEGTDVPKVQTVFLTRQTTSPILLRQMVGRALRGPQFGGTPTANIVLFMDDWREAIQWAEFDEVWGKEAAEAVIEPRRRLPLQLVSIDLIRRLTRQMESGELPPASFRELLPIGWFVPEFDVEVEGSEDTEHLRQMVLVYGDEKAAYDEFLAEAARSGLEVFADPGVRHSALEPLLEALRARFFAAKGLDGSGVGMNLFHLARHLGQTGGQLPPFFEFEQRDEHDLTPTVEMAAREDWGPARTRQVLEGIYCDERRFWRALFPRFDDFREQFRHMVEGRLQRETGAGRAIASAPVIAPPPLLPDPEPSEELKREIVRRDGTQCLCCGRTRKLVVDHIISRYHGGTNDPSNLQTLCSVCNGDKNIQEMHFRKTGTLLKSAPPFKFAPGFDSSNIEDLVHDIRRTVNMFYQCAAVDGIEWKLRGIKRREWRVRLRSGNPFSWLEEHLMGILERVREAQAGEPAALRSLFLEAPSENQHAERRTVRVGTNETSGLRPLPASQVRPRISLAVYWPALLELPNQPIPAKVIRVDAGKKIADVRATIGRSERELAGVPFKALFDRTVLDSASGEDE